MTVNDFLKSVFVALEEQAIDIQTEAPKKEEANERKKLSNAEFLTAILLFGIGKDDAELLDKIIKSTAHSIIKDLQDSLCSFFSQDEQDNKEDDEDGSNTSEEKEAIMAKDQLEMAKADVAELKQIVANLRSNNNDLAKANQELRVENHDLRIENEAMAKQCDALNQELKKVKGDCDALKVAAQTIVKYLTQK